MWQAGGEAVHAEGSSASSGNGEKRPVWLRQRVREGGKERVRKEVKNWLQASWGRGLLREATSENNYLFSLKDLDMSWVCCISITRWADLPITKAGRREGTGSSKMTITGLSQQKESFICTAVPHGELAGPRKPVHHPESKLQSPVLCKYLCRFQNPLPLKKSPSLKPYLLASFKHNLVPYLCRQMSEVSWGKDFRPNG